MHNNLFLFLVLEVSSFDRFVSSSIHFVHPSSRFCSFLPFFFQFFYISLYLYFIPFFLVFFFKISFTFHSYSSILHYFAFIAYFFLFLHIVQIFSLFSRWFFHYLPFFNITYHFQFIFLLLCFLTSLLIDSFSLLFIHYFYTFCLFSLFQLFNLFQDNFFHLSLFLFQYYTTLPPSTLLSVLLFFLSFFIFISYSPVTYLFAFLSPFSHSLTLTLSHSSLYFVHLLIFHPSFG